MTRALLGSLATLGSRSRIYLAQDAIEIDEIEGYTGTRKRVLLDEVLLVTLDRRRSRSLLIGLGLVAALVGLCALAGVGRVDLGGLGIVAVFLSPFLAIMGFHAAVGSDYVTIFGKRTIAQMMFRFPTGRANAVFLQVRERIAEAQEQARRDTAAALPAVPAPSTSAA